MAGTNHTATQYHISEDLPLHNDFHFDKLLLIISPHLHVILYG